MSHVSAASEIKNYALQNGHQALGVDLVMINFYLSDDQQVLRAC